jgi:hypothetical protein
MRRLVCLPAGAHRFWPKRRRRQIKQAARSPDIIRLARSAFGARRSALAAAAPASAGQSRHQLLHARSGLLDGLPAGWPVTMATNLSQPRQPGADSCRCARNLTSNCALASVRVRQ